MSMNLMTMPEVSAKTRTPVDTLRYWRHVGKGPPSFKLGRNVLYNESDVDGWIRAKAAAQGVA
jgi:predicted DNA-binding transcriptional regulator AlpA